MGSGGATTLLSPGRRLEGAAVSGLVGRGTRTLLAFGVAYKLDVASVLIGVAAMCIARGQV